MIRTGVVRVQFRKSPGSVTVVTSRGLHGLSWIWRGTMENCPPGGIWEESWIGGWRGMKRVLVLVIVIGLAVGGFLAVRAWRRSGQTAALAGLQAGGRAPRALHPPPPPPRHPPAP